MKTLKKLGAAVMLTFVLSIPVFAGEIDIPGTTPPPPPNSVTTQGEMGTPGAAADETAGSNSSVISVAMSLLEDILSF